MELKDILLYSLCFPSGIYAVYEGINLMNYVSFIKENNPECYQSNPNRNALFFGTMLVLAVL